MLAWQSREPDKWTPDFHRLIHVIKCTPVSGTSPSRAGLGMGKEVEAA